MRVLLINPSYPFEEFPRLLVTHAVRGVGAAVGGARGRDPRPAALAHHAREDRAAHVALPAAGRGDHLGDAEPPHRGVDRRGRAEVRRLRAHRDGRAARRASRSRAASATCRRWTTSRSARASTPCASSCRALEGRMDLRDMRGLALRDGDRVVKQRAAPARGRPRHACPSRRATCVPVARYLAFDSHASVVTSRGCPYSCVFCSAPRGPAARCATAPEPVRRRDREARATSASPRSRSRTTCSRSTASTSSRCAAS